MKCYGSTWRLGRYSRGSTPRFQTMNPFRQTATEQTDDYPIFYRASGEMVCPTCGKTYYRHPHDMLYLDWQDNPWLRRLCNGELIKT